MTDFHSLPQPIPAEYRDLFEKKAFGTLATLMPNGSPQVTPVWVVLDEDGLVVFNSVKGHQKDRNIRRRRRVALSIMDPENPYRYISVRGPVVEISEKTGDAVIDQLSAKYTGDPVYPWRQPGEVRVTYRMRPESVHTEG